MLVPLTLKRNWSSIQLHVTVITYEYKERVIIIIIISVPVGSCKNNYNIVNYYKNKDKITYNIQLQLQ